MPEFGVPVLVCDGEIIAVYELVGISEDCSWEVCHIRGYEEEDLDFSSITHWMQLPPAPR